MNITTVEYSKTFNLGNYESEKIGLTADVNTREDGQPETWQEVLQVLKDLVAAQTSKK